MSQFQYYQTLYMQPNRHATSECHNHNIIKQFIRSQTNTRPANGKNHNIIKQFICSQTNTWPVSVTITILSNTFYVVKQTRDQWMSQSQYYQTVYTQPNKHTTSKWQKSQYCQTIYMQPNKHMTSKCHNYNIIKHVICSQTNTLPVNVTFIMLSSKLYAAKQIHDQ